MPMMTTANILGRNVRAARLARDYNKVQFCLTVGISRPLLDLIETGGSNLMLEKLVRIAEVLEVEPWELLYDGFDPYRIRVRHAQTQ